MTAREWKPGDVAMVVNYGGEEKLCRLGEFGGQWIFSDGSTMPVEGTSARPLAVIDPEDREQVERLGKAFHDSEHLAPWHDLHRDTTAQIVAALRAALREFAAPTPQIEEPTGLGAVVEVESQFAGPGEMRRLVRTHNTTRPWFGDTISQAWSEIPGPIRVLSEGVQP